MKPPEPLLQMPRSIKTGKSMTSYSQFLQSPWPNAELAATCLRVEKVLLAFGRMRSDRDLTSEDVVIFLATGQLGLAPSALGVSVRPVTNFDISELLKIPKETVRRKTARLVKLNLLTATTRGVKLKNVDEWRSLASALTD